jgi:peptidoglycan/LPS O-acetylase OafA/YrhL
LAIGLASFVLNIALIGTNPVATFYLPFSRPFELPTGAALACAWDQLRQSGAASNLRAGVGIALMARASAALDSHSAFPGWWALLPVTGGALLLSAPAAWGARHLLASPRWVWIGQISYPLDLWHWPLLAIFAIIKFAPLTLLEHGLIMRPSFLLAFATYRLVEIPIRFGRPVPLKTAVLTGAMALVALAGGVVFERGGFDFRLTAENSMADVPEQSVQWRVHPVPA